MANNDIAYMRNTVLFGKPYLWFQRKGENLRLLNLDKANELARTELGIDSQETSEAQEGSHVQDGADSRD